MNITIADHETLINETITNRKTREKRSTNYIYNKNSKKNTQHTQEREREREQILTVY